MEMLHANHHPLIGMVRKKEIGAPSKYEKRGTSCPQNAVNRQKIFEGAGLDQNPGRPSDAVVGYACEGNIVLDLP
jgi:hypothetical protein